jgi:hypothetical protein
MKKFSIREAALTAMDIKYKDVEVPQWTRPDGTPVVIRCKTMSAAQRAAWIEASADKSGNFRASRMYDMVLTNCFDPETDELVFEAGDRDTLMSKSAAAVELLQNAIFVLSGLTKEAEEEAVKN